MARISSFRQTGERYPVLRLLATIGFGLGFFLITVAGLLILAGIGALLFDIVKPANGLLYSGIALLWSIGLIGGGIQFIAMASVCRLAIHVEENTRATAQALDRIRSSLEPKPEVDSHSLFLS